MSKVIDLKEEVKKKNRKKLIMKIIIAAVIMYVIYAIYLIARTSTDTINVESGVITEEETATGVIIRDEVVVKGKNFKNGIYQILYEGEKTAKNQTIFRYYGKAEDELQEKIAAVDKKIQEALDKEKKSILYADVKTLEQQIDEKVRDLRKTTDIQAISEYKKEIANAMLKKATIIGETSQSGSYIKKLIAQRENYEKELEKNSEYIRAPISGVVSYRVDGLEEALGTNNLENLKVEDLENLDIKTGKIIAGSNEMGKVIDNFGCYIATIVDSNAAKNAEVGDKIKITISNGDEITAEVFKINEEGEKRLIILKIGTLENELIIYRKISFNITWWSYSGIKVPNESIIEENGLKYVINKTTKGNEKILIKVLKQNDTHSIIGTYSAEDLKGLGIDSKDYKGIGVHDTILMYP